MDDHNDSKTQWSNRDTGRVHGWWLRHDEPNQHADYLVFIIKWADKRRFHIVEAHETPNLDGVARGKYNPLAGPFVSLEAAQAAWLLMYGRT